jgi:hypothetical protein
LSLSFRFSDQNYICIYHLSDACCMLRPSHPRFVDPNNILV